MISIGIRYEFKLNFYHLRRLCAIKCIFSSKHPTSSVCIYRMMIRCENEQQPFQLSRNLRSLLTVQSGQCVKSSKLLAFILWHLQHWQITVAPKVGIQRIQFIPLIGIVVYLWIYIVRGWHFYWSNDYFRFCNSSVLFSYILIKGHHLWNCTKTSTFYFNMNLCFFTHFVKLESQKPMPLVNLKEFES